MGQGLSQASSRLPDHYHDACPSSPLFFFFFYLFFFFFFFLTLLSSPYPLLDTLFSLASLFASTGTVPDTVAGFHT